MQEENAPSLTIIPSLINSSHCFPLHSTMKFLVSKQWRCVAWLLPSIVSATFHGCLEPEPATPMASECSTPEIATYFCHGPTCSAAETDSCTILTHALLVEHQQQLYGIDSVILPARTCQGPFHPGPLHLHTPPLNRTLNNEALVTVAVSGRDLLALLEHGLELRHVLKREDAYPRVAGLRYAVYPKRNHTRISKPAILMQSSCRFVPIRPDTVYRILTVPSWIQQSRSSPVGQRVFFSSSSSSSASSVPVGHDVVQAFEAYTRRVCVVQDPSNMRRRQPWPKPNHHVVPHGAGPSNATNGSYRGFGPRIGTTAAHSR